MNAFRIFSERLSGFGAPFFMLSDPSPACFRTPGGRCCGAWTSCSLSLWQVLRGLDLVLRPGTVTALCGGSGGGKSTVARLVLRDYDATVYLYV